MKGLSVTKTGVRALFAADSRAFCLRFAATGIYTSCLQGFHRRKKRFPPGNPKGPSYTWLFHLHSMVKIQPFSPVFPLADFMAETFYWLFPWNFKEKGISHFLWHSPEKSHLCKQTGASRRPAENRKGPSLWRAASRSREMAAGGPHCRPYGGLRRHLRIKSISSASLKGTSVPSRTSAARARLERWSLRMDSSTVPRATSR